MFAVRRWSTGTRVRVAMAHGCALIVLLVATLVPIALTAGVPAGADVVMNSNNLLRNGWYPNQTTLTPATVSGGNFGRLFSAPVAGQV